MPYMKAAVFVLVVLCLMPVDEGRSQDKYRLDATVNWSDRQLQDAVARLRRLGFLPELVGKAGELPYNPERIAQHQDMIILVDVLLRRIDTLENRLSSTVSRQAADYASKSDAEKLAADLNTLEGRADRIDTALQTDYMTAADLTGRFARINGVLDSLTRQSAAIRAWSDSSFASADSLSHAFLRWERALTLVRTDMDSLRTGLTADYLRKDDIDQKADKVIDKYAKSYVEDARKKDYARDAVRAALSETDIMQQFTTQLSAYIQDKVKDKAIREELEAQIARQLTDDMRNKIRAQIMEELMPLIRRDIESAVDRLTDEKIKAFEKRLEENRTPVEPPQ